MKRQVMFADNFCHGRNDGAFTMSDLIVVLAVIFLLAVMQFSVAANIKGKGHIADCLYNHRQLSRAWQLYAQDNGSRLVGNMDGGEVMNPSNSNKTWVLGWFDFSGGNHFPDAFGGFADTNTYVLTQLSPLAPYLGRSSSVFKCPADTSLGEGVRGAPRVRSVSMNAYMGERVGPYTSGYKQFKKFSEIIHPAPVEAFVFIDEREDSINDGWLAFDMGGFEPRQPSAYTIVDYPADWHNRGVNLSFADGHTETWHWRDPRTMPFHRAGGLIPLGVPSPNNPDVARLQRATTRRWTPGN